MGRKGLPISSFTDPEAETEETREPSQTELIAYATEMLMATIHVASDKIAAAILTAEWNRATLAHPTITIHECKTIADDLSKGYNMILERIRVTEDETRNGGNDGERQQEDQEDRDAAGEAHTAGDGSGSQEG